MDPADLMNDPTNLDINEENSDKQQNRKNKEVDVIVGKKKETMTIAKAPTNPLAFKDIEFVSEELAAKKNWETMRSRMRIGKEIELEYRKHVYEQILECQPNDTDDVNAVTDAFARLNN